MPTMRAYNEQAPISVACQSGQGYAGGDLRYTGLTSTKGARDRAAQWQNGTKPPVNVRTHVKPCAGYVFDADTKAAKPSSANSRNKAKRHGQIRGLARPGSKPVRF